MKDVVIANDLSCFYGVVLGLNRVNFSIPSGITGLVGPNGAGKSTLIRVITGQVEPSAGSLTVLGQKPRNNNELLSQIGYCPEHEHIHKNVTPIVWLRSLCSMSGLSWVESKRRSLDVLKRVELPESAWKKNIGAFSKGMKQRVKLAQAIIHDPKLLILDEPMNGLDPMGRNEISLILKDLKQSGVHIIISSHILNELESLCENFILLKWGRVVASGNRSEIAQGINHKSDKVRIRTDNPNKLIQHLSKLDLLKGYLLQDDDLLVWLSDTERFYNDWPKFLNVEGVSIYDIVDEGASLENIFNSISS